MKIWLIGATGLLGSCFRQKFSQAGVTYVCTRSDLDLADAGALRSFATGQGFTHVINCAAYNKVDDAELPQNRDRVFAVNEAGPAQLARLAVELGMTAVHYSTDYVFDGTKRTEYTETDAANPISVYGQSKLAGERAFLAGMTPGLGYCLRVSWLFGGPGVNFAANALQQLMEREELKVVYDAVSRFTLAPQIVDVTLRLLGLHTSTCAPATPAAPAGLYQFANAEPASRFDFASAVRELALQRGFPVKTKQIIAVRAADFYKTQIRPLYSAMSSAKLEAALNWKAPSWRSALADYMATVKAPA